MAGIAWTEDEIKTLVNLHQEKSCEEISKILGRSLRSVQHKFGELKLKRKRAEVGDVVKGWEILEIYYHDAGSQKIAMAKTRSTLEDKTEKEFRLTKLTLGQVGWPDKRGDKRKLMAHNRTHGESESRLYRIWAGMLSRAGNPKQKSRGYKNISVCDEWKDYITFRDWSNNNGYAEDLTLDRIDFNGNYCPENCRWTDWATQTENRSCSIDVNLTAFGETKSIYKWVNDPRCVVTIYALKYRVMAGWGHEQAITQQPERKRRKELKVWIKEHYPEIYKEWKISKE